jgi:hypothetical protein
MPQECDYSWSQPYPLPLVNQPLAGPNVVLPEGEPAEAPAISERKAVPPEPPRAAADDDYQWMVLL